MGTRFSDSEHVSPTICRSSEFGVSEKRVLSGTRFSDSEHVSPTHLSDFRSSSSEFRKNVF